MNEPHPFRAALTVLFPFACGYLAYPWLAEHVGNDLAGRSNASINFAIFAAAFAIQYLIGAVIGFFPATATGYDPAAYSWAFGMFLVLQLLAFAWYLLAPRINRQSCYGQPRT